jgi:hypothetical protein
VKCVISEHVTALFAAALSHTPLSRVDYVIVRHKLLLQPSWLSHIFLVRYGVEHRAAAERGSACGQGLRE